MQQSIPWGEIGIVIGIFASLVAIIVGISAISSKREAKATSMIEIKEQLKTIISKVSDIQVDMKDMKTTSSNHSERILALELDVKIIKQTMEKLVG